MCNNIVTDKAIIDDIKVLIFESRQTVAYTVNSAVSLLYWNIGKRINEEILQNSRAEYGKQILETLSKHLTEEYGNGWSKRQLSYCVKFYNIFNNYEILRTLCSKLSWSHLRLLLYMDDPLKRDFYTELCKLEKWSVRQLQERIKSMLFERTAISKKPEETIIKDIELLKKEKVLSPDLVFRDPYFLDFLGLTDTYSEKELESSIIVELQKFIIELGSDFAFMARQKHISIDNRDYYIDLLFYHRRLKCLVAIDLKIGEFDAAYKGKMELYLRYLQKYEQLEDENTPVGLILCTGKNEEHIELLQLDQSNIKVADYLTILPSKELLQTKLHKAIEIAQQKINKNDENTNN